MGTEEELQRKQRERRGSQNSATLITSSSTIPNSVAVGPKSNPLYKTRYCQSFEKTGQCTYNDKCQFAHGKEEMERWHVWRLAQANQNNVFASTSSPNTIELMNKYNAVFQSPSLPMPSSSSISQQNGAIQTDFLSELNSHRRSTSSVLSANVSFPNNMDEETRQASLSSSFDTCEFFFNQQQPYRARAETSIGSTNSSSNENYLLNGNITAAKGESYNLFDSPSLLPSNPEKFFKINIPKLG